jgi:hypothetical protein
MRLGLVAVGTRRNLHGLLAVVLISCGCGALLARAPSAFAKVLHVGTFEGKIEIRTIHEAVERASPGDWILIAPGDYKETGDPLSAGASAGAAGAGVLIEKSGIHIRGMSRGGVVIDGTKKRTPKCSSNPADQELGPLDSAGHHTGRNGLEVFKSPGVSVENLTVCNFLTGSAGGGAQIWFNFGDTSGKQQSGSWRGAYLSATSTFYESKEAPLGLYGTFTSNNAGPGLYTQVYADNMAASALAIVACPDCNTTIDHAHAENSAVGYTGQNTGGHFTVQNSEFDNNKAGFISNSQNNDDAPSPQDGACPNGGTGPTGSHNCWLFTKNSAHDNNNPNVPSAGGADSAPAGTGVVLSGTHNDVINGNTVYNNGAWGILLIPFPDAGEPPAVANCAGGTSVEINRHHVCYFDDFGNEVTNNLLKNNGFFGNPSNVDLAEIANADPPPATGNCWHGNEDENEPGKKTEPTSEPKEIQKTHGECGKPDLGGEPLTSSLGAQVSCNSQFFAPSLECPTGTGANYPRLTKVELKPLPEQKTMANPCEGVPRNSWCPNNKPARLTPPYPVPGEPAA